MLDQLLERSERVPLHVPVGTVLDVVGLIIEVGGLRAAVGETLLVQSQGAADLDVEVVGFRNGRLLVTPLGPIAGIRPGARVVRTNRGSNVPVGPEARPCPLRLASTLRPARRRADKLYPAQAPRRIRSIASVDAALHWRRVLDSRVPLGLGHAWASSPRRPAEHLLVMVCRASQADVTLSRCRREPDAN